jgi:hypothetical protein
MFFKALSIHSPYGHAEVLSLSPHHSARHHIGVVELKASRGCGHQWNAVYTQFHDTLSLLVWYIDVRNGIHRPVNTVLAYSAMELK